MDYDLALEKIGEVVDPDLMARHQIDHLSYSNLDLFSKCSEKWRHRYILKQRGGKTVPMAIGSGIHRGIEFYHLGKTTDEQEQAAKDKFNAEAPDGPKGAAEGSIIRMLAAYRERFSQPATATEKENRVELGRGVELVAVTDVVQEGCAADIKSTTQTRDNFSPDPFQLFLNLLVLHANGTTLEAAEVRPIRRDVTGARTPIVLEPFHYEVNGGFIAAQAGIAVERINSMNTRLRSGLFTGPEYEKKWMCNHCEHTATCVVLNTPVQPVAAA